VFDHIGIGVSDLKASKAFFLRALSSIGVQAVMEFPDSVGLGQGQKPSFWLHPTEGKPLSIHLAFTAADRKQVDVFYREALAAGGKDNGPPGLRPHYHANYYAAFVFGPDGHNVEVVCHKQLV